MKGSQQIDKKDIPKVNILDNEFVVTIIVALIVVTLLLFIFWPLIGRMVLFPYSIITTISKTKLLWSFQSWRLIKVGMTRNIFMRILAVFINASLIVQGIIQIINRILNQ